MVDVKMWRRRRQPNHSDGRRAECPATAPRRGTQKRAPGGPETNLETEQEEQNMKKRLLSAALALAMVLTMLPLSVFAAAATPATASVTWYAKGTVWTDSTSGSPSTPLAEGGWYTRTQDTTDKSKYVYEKKTTGVLNNSNTSGSATWTASIGDALQLNWSTIRLLGDNTAAITTDKTNITIDVDGHTNSGAVTMTKGGTLTIKDTSYKNDSAYTMKSGAGAIAMTGELNYTCTVNLTNVTATSITMDKVGQHTVNLDNAKLENDGAVTMTGIGKYTNASGSEVSVNARQTFTATNSSKVGALTVTGNSSAITVTNSVTGKVSLTGLSTTLTVNGSTSQVGETDGVELCASKAALTSGTAPRVTVNGGKVGKISAASDEKLENARYTVEVNGTSNGETGNIELKNANVTVNGGTASNVSINSGSLSVTNNGSVGNVTWGGSESGTVNLTVSGAGTTVGDVVPATSNKATLGTVSITGGTFGSDFNLGTYSGNGVSGGTFGASIMTKTGYRSWLSKSLEYEVCTNPTNGTYSYVGSDFQNLVNLYKTLDPKTCTIKRINAKDSGTSTITFAMEEDKNGDAVELVKITGNPNEAILAPSTVNNVPVSNWYEKGGTGASATPAKTYAAGQAIPFPANGDRTVYVTLPGGDSSDIIDVSSSGDISATLSGNVIRLSGYAPADKADAFAVKLTITTAQKVYENAVTLTWWSNLKTFGLSGAVSPFGIVGNTLAYNGKTYSFDISGLRLLSSSAISVVNSTTDSLVNKKDLDGKDIKGLKVTFNAGETASRPNFATSVVGAGAQVDFSKSPAVLEALNREAGKISNVSTYINAAKNAAAKKDGITRPTNEQLASYTYNTVVIQPYLNVVVDAYTPGGNNSVGTMRANITPYYYIIVIDNSTGTAVKPYIYNPNGTSLGTLSGDYGEVEVTLGLPSNFTPASKEIWVHHGNYVYEAKLTGKTSISFKTLHGFSPFTINGTGSEVEVDHVQGQPDSDKTGDKWNTRYYDSLQAAVNDVADKGTITLNNNYNGTKNINVTGVARTFTVDCGSNGNLALTFSGADVSTTRPTNNRYQVTLSANSTAPSTSTTISVASATGGSASVSSSSAKPGDTVTVTPRAVSGYKVSGVTAVTNTGASVPVKANSNGTYTFTVPANATKVTVTPRFVASENRIFPDVDPKSWYGPSVKYCYETTVRGVRLMEGDANGNFAPNAKLTRAQMVQMLYNLAGRPTVTGACPFPDVVGTGYDWAAAPITWAAQKGYVIGYSDGKFHPEVNVSRQDMVLILYRYAKQPAIGASGSLSGYYDASSVGSWAYDAVRWAASMGILSGTNSVALNGYINGPVRANRCEVAVTLANFHRLYG